MSQRTSALLARALILSALLRKSSSCKFSTSSNTSAPMASDSESADIGWITAMETKLAWVAAANCMAAFADFSERGEPSVGTRIFLNMVNNPS